MRAMRSILPFLTLVLIGCGARTINDFGIEDFTSVDSATADAASDTIRIVDAAVIDTGTEPRPDSKPPPPPDTCETPLSPGFACIEPPTIAGKKVCNDEAIRALAAACFGFGGEGSKCNAAMKKYNACSNCMLNDWVDDSHLQTGACIKKVDPGNKCAKVIDCTYDCLGEVCGSCDPSPGSGKGGGSEADECYETASSSGGCYDLVVKDYEICAGDPKIAACMPNTEDDLILFYRGACRDGGDWTKAAAGDGT